MKVCVLSSGSKGNCTYVETENKKILIDIGTNCHYVENSLLKLGLNASQIDIILITHSHVDHIAGLKVFAKKYKTIVFTTKQIYSEIGLKLEHIEFIEKNATIDDVKIFVLPTSHDVSSVGYVIESDNKSLVYITDTGYVKEKYYKYISNKSIYIFESNHDVEKLMNNKKYPHYLKIRILSDKGHLSNADSAYCLSNLCGPNTKSIILAHLSEENNTPSLALSTLKHEFLKHHIDFQNIIVAKQNEETELIEV